MRHMLSGLSVLALLCCAAAPAPSKAQPSSAVVVSTCGTPPGTYVAGQSYPLTQNTNGNACTSASASGTFTDAATGATGSPVPGSASYTGLNVAGNLRGWSGLNPSGSIYAGYVYQDDGYSVTLGTKADAATCATTNTAIACLRQLHADLIAALPAGTNLIGKVGIDQTTPGTTNGVQVNAALPAGTNVIGHVVVDSAPTTAVTGTFWQATQPVSAASLPLPTGAATSAKQPALGTAGTPSTDVLTVQGAATGTPLPVVAGGNSYANITTSTTTTVKSGAGVLHTVCVNSLGTVASSTTVYDSTTGSGTKIATLNTLALLGCQTYDVAFSTGLTIVTTGTVAPDITASYR